jgi:uncharacterized caspase-like protein/predicted nuclease with TOPRIM domain
VRVGSASISLSFIMGSVGPIGTAPAMAQTGAQDADGLMIVDCLLPGQIRRLGGMVTYVSARRAVKTAASDCEIRGGEYVASDRASYATALKVWLPLAKEGKPDAQTYVGEIFEKGLGVPPDFQAAASWYQRAAEQGFSRAAINLGSLYERGLGVPKDPAQALVWYRKAAGLPDLKFQVGPPGPAAAAPAPAPMPAEPSAEARAKAEAQQAELERLRGEIETLKRRLSEKEDELKRTRDRLDDLKRNLDRSSGEADGQRAALDRLRQQLAEKRTQEGASAAEVKALEAAVAERQSRLARKDQEIDRLRASLSRLESQTKSQQAALQQLKRKSRQTGPAIEIIEPELASARGYRMAKVPESVDKLLVVGRVASASGLAALSVNGRNEKLDGEVFRTNIPVTGIEKHVRIVAIDRNGRKAVVEFVVPERRVAVASVTTGPGNRVTEKIGYTMPSPPINFGRYFALVIGNNNYRHLPKLDTAVLDATEVARILKDMYGYDVTLLLNATRYQILSGLNKLREKLTDADNLLIYYGGHGELDQVNQRGNWLPVDAEPNSSANWISNVAITDVLNAMTVRELLVVADSCYSGTLTRSALAHISGAISEREHLQLVREMARQRSRMALTAGGIQPVLDSGGGKHSAFAQAFIDVLENNSGILAGQDLFRVLQTRVAAAARRANADQVPEYAPIKFAGHEAGDFFFVRTAAN